MESYGSAVLHVSSNRRQNIVRHTFVRQTFHLTDRKYLASGNNLAVLDFSKVFGPCTTQSLVEET